MDRQLLRQTLRYGSVTALQQSCQPIGKLLIQGAVNPRGVDMSAAFNAVNRIDDYAFTPEQSISLAVSYTHLDVYKRQILEYAVQLFGWKDGAEEEVGK